MKIIIIMKNLSYKNSYWNICTMTLFLGYYMIELYRYENWSIKYLDIDNNQPDEPKRNYKKIQTS